MANAYELIEYSGTNFKFSMSRLTYVTPHMHHEIEFGLCFQGDMHIVEAGKETLIQPGQFWYLNPGVGHEILSGSPHRPYLSLHVQFPPAFFQAYFPQMDRVRLSGICLSRELLGPEIYQSLRSDMIICARSYYRRDVMYPLVCAAGINHMMSLLLSHVPYETLSEEELQNRSILSGRIQRLTDYITDHAHEKLLLSDLARQEGLSLTYLSHLFTQQLGMSFQTCLMRIRCRRAAMLLLSTRDTLSDISLKSGFSALKYMRTGFQEVYGCSPEVFRELYRDAPPQPVRQASPGEFRAIGRGFTPQESLYLLDLLA